MLKFSQLLASVTAGLGQLSFKSNLNLSSSTLRGFSGLHLLGKGPRTVGSNAALLPATTLNLAQPLGGRLCNSHIPTNDLKLTSLCAELSRRTLHTSSSFAVNSFLRIHIMGPIIKPPRKKNPLGYGVPFRKGVVLKTVIKKPRKPNSANRKCVLLRLSNGKEMTAFVPGEGHTLQEHNVVLVHPGRLRDTPGVKIRCMRGKYDLGEVVKKTI